MGGKESLVSPLVLVNNEDKENNPCPGIGAVTAYRHLGVLQGGSMDVWEFIKETQAILQEHSGDIVAVRGQHAFRSLGLPKSCYNPYSSIRCYLRPGRQFLRQPSHPNCHVGSADNKLSSVLSEPTSPTGLLN